AKSMGLILKDCDPLRAAIDSARKEKIKIYAYVTLFDESYPGLESEFSEKHPEYCWKHRHCDHVVKGLLDYAYPEVKKHRLDEIKELLSYEPDGIYLDVARSHAAGWPIMALPLGTNPWENYGFNEPEVEEFKRRYGVDVRLKNLADAPFAKFDEEKWNRLRGEYLTGFLKEVRSEIKSADKKLSVGFYTDADCYLSPAGCRGRTVMGKFYHDWQTWVGVVQRASLASGPVALQFSIFGTGVSTASRAWQKNQDPAARVVPFFVQGVLVVEEQEELGVCLSEQEQPLPVGAVEEPRRVGKLVGAEVVCVPPLVFRHAEMPYVEVEELEGAAAA
ncbi:MAG: hypothetical protein UY52_C0024G0001, partial [Parcubacteria group bacterium GW2011_GWC2_49_9]